jgi:soluble lytic murein transglycosylase-like protein
MKINTIDNQISAQAVRQKNQAQTAAREFESIFTSYMLKSMRSTIPENEFMPMSLGENIYTEMLDGEYAKMMSSSGNLGLAGMILKQIDRSSQDAVSPQQMLKGLNRDPWMIDNRFIQSTPTASTVNRDTKAAVAQFKPIIDEASRTFNVDSSLISAVIARESAGNQYAVSRAGAKGLMQLMDATASDLGTSNVWDPYDNIMSGTKYLSDMLKRFNNDEQLALASYNAGPGAVEAHNGMPPFRETQEYVNAVQRLKNQFAQVDNNNKDVSNETTVQ